jgi:hypothetical protein
MVRDRDIDDEMLALLKQRPNTFFQQTLWGERLVVLRVETGLGG